MKKNLILTGAFVAMMCFFGMSNVNAQEEVETKEYCTVDQFQEGNGIHGRGIGESRKQQMAREKARAAALKELAENIQMNLKALTIDYSKSVSLNDEDAVIEGTRQMSKRIVDQNMSNLKTVCEKGVTYTNSNGVKMYTYYQMVEFDKSKLEKAAYDSMKKEGLLKANESFENFSEKFDNVFKDMPDGVQPGTAE